MTTFPRLSRLMGQAPRMRRLTVPVLLGALLMMVASLAGCATQADSPIQTGTPVQPNPAAVAIRLTRAVEGHNQADWRRATPAMPAGRRDLLWSNLEQLDRVDFRPDGADLIVSWSVPGDAAPARQRIRAVWRCRPLGCQLADLLPRRDAPAPIWLTGPIRLMSADGVTVLDGRASPAAPSPGTSAGVPALSSATPSWGTIAQVARGRLMKVDLGNVASGWNGQLVVEVPATSVALGQVMGLSVRKAVGVGALTWVEDGGLPPDSATGGATAADPSTRAGAPTAAVRIVVNPATTAGLSDSGASLLITHEAVHVATATLGPPPAGRHWLSEGLAEWVALASVPDQLVEVKKLARDACLAAAGRPGVPSDANLAADPTAARRAYAVAWTIMAELATQQGSSGVIRAASDWSGLPAGQPDELAARWCASQGS